MFVWIKLLNGIEDSYKLITTAAVDKKVLAVPGVVSNLAIMLHFLFEFTQTSILGICAFRRANAIRSSIV
jgi:hypothetical protein